MRQEGVPSLVRTRATVRSGFAARLKGPGGLYNIGNAIGLMSGSVSSFSPFAPAMLRRTASPRP